MSLTLRCMIQLTLGDGLMPSDAEGSAGVPPLGVMAKTEFDAELPNMLAWSFVLEAGVESTTLS